MIALARLAAEASELADLEVRGVAIDSRRVTEGSLFIALQGDSADGHDFIDAAVMNGAAAVFAERSVSRCGVPLVVVENLAARVSQIAGEFFGHPSRHFDCVAVTGTNGKTSVAHFTAELAAQLGVRAGFLGTTGWGFVEPAGADSVSSLSPATLTTADAVSLQERLHKLHEGGVELVALEMSSHALQQHRGDALGIDVALFTNLSRDHLDYHGSMAEYGAAKARLFELPTLRAVAVNADDSFGATLVRSLEQKRRGTPVLSLVSDSESFAASETAVQALCIKELSSTADGMSWLLCGPWGELRFHSQVIGRYNAVNLSLAIAALALLGHDPVAIAAVVPAVQAPAGRLQRVGDSPGIFIDYAHTPDALETVLKAARAHCTGRLICVFGCGGDRDKGKRVPMGRAVAQYADLGWLTSDNPRFEDPETIIADVEAGLPPGVIASGKIRSVVNRRTAIAEAITAARADDVLIIAGKGHEDYQDIQGVRQPFDDAQIARDLLLRGAR